MDFRDEVLLRLQAELLILKPAIKWLLAREARRSHRPAPTLKQLSDLVGKRIAALPIDEGLRIISQIFDARTSRR